MLLYIVYEVQFTRVKAMISICCNWNEFSIAYLFFRFVSFFFNNNIIEQKYTALTIVFKCVFFLFFFFLFHWSQFNKFYELWKIMSDPFEICVCVCVCFQSGAIEQKRFLYCASDFLTFYILVFFMAFHFLIYFHGNIHWRT